ncbi:unnamed protein product [Adineta steineri]|uniref:Protein kinase domain-containing protein n=1 Tax=Adineta steineri TaxID=433720 RepID=A0A814SUR1_9BILA|nr:unnamed protein product [Adineta steineri]CAF4127268.1 unnamed protein product [Adineta steineri]
MLGTLAIRNTGTEYALKISNESVDKEVSIYEKLYANKYKIIQVHPYTFVFCFSPGQIISKENLFNNIHIIWNQIRRAHENHIVHRDIRMSNIIQILNSQTKNYEILLIDWHSAIEIDSNVKYSGSVSTASNFILDKLSQNSKEASISSNYKNTISLKVLQHSSSGVLTCYVGINYDFRCKQLLLLGIINSLEKHRENLSKEKLNYFIDKCVENHRCLIKLENEQTDINYFNDLTKQIFLS